MSANNEQLFVTGKIFTGRSETDFVTAFNVADGKITWTGSCVQLYDMDMQAVPAIPGMAIRR